MCTPNKTQLKQHFKWCARWARKRTQPACLSHWITPPPPFEKVNQNITGPFGKYKGPDFFFASPSLSPYSPSQSSGSAH
jgi:hypothetical protein